MGSAPSPPVNSPYTMSARGTSAAANTTGFATNRTNCSWVNSGSEVLPQVHPRVELCHVLRIPVERQRGTLDELADAAFPLLTPPRVIHVRVHVGVEPV